MWYKSRHVHKSETHGIVFFIHNDLTEPRQIPVPDKELCAGCFITSILKGGGRHDQLRIPPRAVLHSPQS